MAALSACKSNERIRQKQALTLVFSRFLFKVGFFSASLVRYYAFGGVLAYRVG